MPNRITADEIGSQGHRRNYIQFGGPRPNNAVAYAGQDAQYLAIDGVAVPESGGIDPRWVPDPQRPGSYRLVGRSISPPDLASATLQMLERHGSIPIQLTKLNCVFNLYENVGTCKDLSDFLAGWTDYILIYSQALVTDKDLGTRSGWDTDDQIVDSLSLTLATVYPIGPLSFGTNAAPLIDREVIDVVYGSTVQCGDCGPQDDGTKRIYAIVKSSGSGSPGLPGELIYSVDGGLTWSETLITGLGATEDPVGIDWAGDKLIVITKLATAGAIYYATINADTGVPGSWTKVTTGLVANAAPNDLTVLTSREIYFAADSGYIYKSTDIASGVTAVSAGGATSQNLYRIHGVDETIVASGGNSVVVVSTNRGRTWGTTAANPSALPLDNRALLVLDAKRYWVGTLNSGRMFYTLNGGASWTESPFSGAGSGSVRDIVAATDEVLFMSHDTNTPTARIFTSWNGGRDWTNTSPRILNLPTFNRGNRIAVPNAHESVAANNIAVAGLAGDGTDGILILGVTSKL